MSEEPVKQENNRNPDGTFMDGENTGQQHKRQYDWLKQYQWQKGQSGNPSGGKKGKKMKTLAAEILGNMSDEEKAEWLKTQNNDFIWRMAEGNPTNDTKVSGSLTISQVLDEIQNE